MGEEAARKGRNRMPTFDTLSDFLHFRSPLSLLPPIEANIHGYFTDEFTLDGFNLTITYICTCLVFSFSFLSVTGRCETNKERCRDNIQYVRACGLTGGAKRGFLI